MTEQQSQEPNNAEAIADAMNARLLAAEQEQRFISLQEKNESISKDLREKSEAISSLEQSIMDLESKLKEKDVALSSLQDSVAKVTRRAENAEGREKEINERMARVAVETDSLRQEIRWVVIYVLLTRVLRFSFTLFLTLSILVFFTFGTLQSASK